MSTPSCFYCGSAPLAAWPQTLLGMLGPQGDIGDIRVLGVSAWVAVCSSARMESDAGRSRMSVRGLQRLAVQRIGPRPPAVTCGYRQREAALRLQVVRRPTVEGGTGACRPRVLNQAHLAAALWASWGTPRGWYHRRQALRHSGRKGRASAYLPGGWSPHRAHTGRSLARLSAVVAPRHRARRRRDVVLAEVHQDQASRLNRASAGAGASTSLNVSKLMTKAVAGPVWPGEIRGIMRIYGEARGGLEPFVINPDTQSPKTPLFSARPPGNGPPRPRLCA